MANEKGAGDGIHCPAMRNHFAAAALAYLWLGCAQLPRPAEPPAEFEAAKVHYRDVGTGSRAIVFIHGWACDSTFFDEQFATLQFATPQGAGRMIAIDLPGHGKSEEARPGVDYTMAYWARSIDAVLRHAGIDEAILVGHSNGVPVIRQFYRMYPDRALALVAIDGALIQVVTPEMVAPFIKQLEKPDYKSIARRLATGMARIGDLTTIQQEHIVDVAVNTPQRVLVGGIRAALDAAVWKTDPIKIPVLGVYVKQAAWTADYFTKVKEFVPQFEYHQLSGVNHCLQMDEPEKFNELLLAFLKAHELQATN